MLLHPDGSEELLVPGGDGAVTDPFVSFDGEWVYYSFFPDVRPQAINSQRGLLVAAEGHDVDLAPDHLLVGLPTGSDARSTGAGLNRLAHEHGIVLAALEQRRLNLEDRYLDLVHGGIR